MNNTETSGKGIYQNKAAGRSNRLPNNNAIVDRNPRTERKYIFSPIFRQNPSTKNDLDGLTKKVDVFNETIVFNP